MTNIQKNQIKALLHVLVLRHPGVCDALSQAARQSVPADVGAAIRAVIPVDAAATQDPAAVAALAALVAAVDAIEVQ